MPDCFAEVEERSTKRRVLCARGTMALVSWPGRPASYASAAILAYQAGDRQFAVQAVHIGDSLPADVQGANNAKLAAAILVNRRRKPLPRAGPYPTHMVEHVTELPRILKALQAAG